MLLGENVHLQNIWAGKTAKQINQVRILFPIVLVVSWLIGIGDVLSRWCQLSNIMQYILYQFESIQTHLCSSYCSFTVCWFFQILEFQICV